MRQEGIGNRSGSESEPAISSPSHYTCPRKRQLSPVTIPAPWCSFRRGRPLCDGRGAVRRADGDRRGAEETRNGAAAIHLPRPPTVNELLTAFLSRLTASFRLGTTASPPQMASIGGYRGGNAGGGGSGRERQIGAEWGGTGWGRPRGGEPGGQARVGWGTEGDLSPRDGPLGTATGGGRLCGPKPRDDSTAHQCCVRHARSAAPLRAGGGVGVRVLGW